jgi:hypothetical protein
LKKLIPLVFSVVLAAASCVDKPDDVLVTADGTVVTGKIQSIEPGEVIISGVAVKTPETGRIWCKDGSTYAGVIHASDGVFQAGSGVVPGGSVRVIIWGDTSVYRETFSIDATRGWLNTGIGMEEGEMLSLHSTGAVVTETGTATPQGQEKFSSSVSLVPSATSGQLVFQTGESGQPVAAGSTWVGESPGSGTLMLAINVPLVGSLAPRGVYTVTVTAGTNPGRSGAVVFYPAGR